MKKLVLDHFIKTHNQAYVYNYGHNILRIFDVLPNFPFTTSEPRPDY